MSSTTGMTQLEITALSNTMVTAWSTVPGLEGFGLRPSLHEMGGGALSYTAAEVASTS